MTKNEKKNPESTDGQERWHQKGWCQDCILPAALWIMSVFVPFASRRVYMGDRVTWQCLCSVHLTVCGQAICLSLSQVVCLDKETVTEPLSATIVYSQVRYCFATGLISGWTSVRPAVSFLRQEQSFTPSDWDDVCSATSALVLVLICSKY